MPAGTQGSGAGGGLASKGGAAGRPAGDSGAAPSGGTASGSVGIVEPGPRREAGGGIDGTAPPVAGGAASGATPPSDGGTAPVEPAGGRTGAGSGAVFASGTVIGGSGAGSGL